jgi:hypothetical protein
MPCLRQGDREPVCHVGLPEEEEGPRGVIGAATLFAAWLAGAESAVRIPAW